MLKNWLKIAFLNYRKNALSTFINLFGLALGLTGFMLILILWNNEASYESWNPYRQEIYFAEPYFKVGHGYGSTSSYPFAKYAVEKLPAIQDFVLLNGYGNSNRLSVDGKSVYQDNGASVSGHFFKFFPFRRLSGTYNNALEDENSVAISSKVSMKLFGNTNSAGHKLEIDGKPKMITAVYELPEGNSVMKPDFIVLDQTIKEDKKKDQWGNFNYFTLFKIKRGTDLEKLRKDFYNRLILLRGKMGAHGGNVSPEKFLDLYGPNGIDFTRLDRVNLHAHTALLRKADYKNILTMFGLSVLIVLLSAINFINLKTAQASQRAKEVGVRKAIGGTKSSIMMQFLTETLILCIAAFLLSLVLTELLLPSLNKLYQNDIKLINTRVYLYSLCFALLVSLVSGLVPAVYLSNFKAVNALKGNFSRSRNGIILRNVILSVQLVISSFFMISGLVVHSQVRYMLGKDLGFNGDQVLNINFRDNSNTRPYLKYERMKTEIAKIPGVEEVSFGEAVPAGNSNSSSNVDYRDKSIEAQHGAMDYNYLQMMGVQLKAGRWLDPRLASDTINTMIVNEALVNRFGWTDAQALTLELSPGFDNKPYRIVGIVKDFNIQGLKQKVSPVVFFHYRETEWKRNNMFGMQVKLSGNDIPGTIERLRKCWQSDAEPGYPFSYSFVRKDFAKTFEKYQQQQTLFAILNIVVLLVALLGLFALSSLMIGQKLKDVAIKKTLGASGGSIVLGLTRRFLIVALVAVFISIPISYYFMNEWLKDFAYRIDMPWSPYLLTFAVILILTFAVVSIRAYMATRVNLVKYLKYE